MSTCKLWGHNAPCMVPLPLCGVYVCTLAGVYVWVCVHA